MEQTRNVGIGTAVCGALSSERPNEIQLLPGGPFRAVDGRPQEVDAWRVDRMIAAQIVSRVQARQNPLVIDYEHQTLATGQNGQPAPAAGWFKQLQWREGQGLFAVDVEWTARAKQHISAKEYRFISPVFSYDKASGTVLDILHAALTNNPAVDGMATVAALVAQPTLPRSLDAQELAICALMNVAPEAYLKTKHDSLDHTKTAATHAHGLTAEQLQVCEAMGVEPAAFMAALQTTRF